MFSKKGRILKIKTGFNPNSSSIGTDLTPLLIGASIMAFLIPLIAIIVSKRIKSNKEENTISETNQSSKE